MIGEELAKPQIPQQDFAQGLAVNLEKLLLNLLTLRNVQKHANIRAIQFIDAEKGARNLSFVPEHEEFYGVCADCGDRKIEPGFRI